MLLPLTITAQQSDTTSVTEPSKVEIATSTETTSKHLLNNLRITYGLPGLIPIVMVLGEVMFDSSSPSREVFDQTLSNHINDEHSYWGDMRMFAMLNAEYTHSLKPWLAIGGKFSFGTRWQYERNISTNEVISKDNAYAIATLISFRFDWLHKDLVQLYSGIAVGAAAHIEKGDTFFTPMFDTTYIGVSVGRRVYGIAEVGGGISGIWRIGIGYRF